MLKRTGQGLRAVARVVPVFLRDMAGLAGAASIGYGAWLVHPAAGFITGGVILLAGAILTSLKDGS